MALLAVIFAAWQSELFNPGALPPAPRKQFQVSHNKKAARFAIDGFPDTRWDTGEHQKPGQQVTLDLGEVQHVRSITLDTRASPADYARGLLVEIAQDPTRWIVAVELWPSPAENVLTLFIDQAVRYLRLTQTGHDERNYWSLHELNVDAQRLIPALPLSSKAFRFTMILLGMLGAYGLGVISMRHIRGSSMGLLAAVRIVALACMALQLAAGTLNPEHVWGVFWFSNAPLILQLSLSLMWAAFWCFAPWIARRLAYYNPPAAGWMRRAAIVLIPGTFTLVTWLLRSRTSYGDADGTMQLLDSGEWINWKEPLDRLTTALVYRAGSAFFGLSSQAAIGLVSCSAGFFFILGCFRFARSMDVSRASRLLIMMVFLSTGAIQLYFGNLENYSLLSAGVMWYLASGLRTLRKNISLAVPGVILGITAAFHLSAGWLGASLGQLVFAVWRRNERSQSSRFPAALSRLVLRTAALSAMTAAPVIVSFVLAYLILGGAQELTFENMGGGDGKLWVTFSHPISHYQPYSFLSLTHLINILNEVMLICPGSLILLAACLLSAGWRTFVGFGDDGWFLLSAVFGGMAYLLFFNPDLAFLKIGILNEWDLFSLAAFPLVALALHLWRLHPRADEVERIAALLVIIATSFLSTVPWILSNAKIF